MPRDAQGIPVAPLTPRRRDGIIPPRQRANARRVVPWLRMSRREGVVASLVDERRCAQTSVEYLQSAVAMFEHSAHTTHVGASELGVGRTSPVAGVIPRVRFAGRTRGITRVLGAPARERGPGGAPQRFPKGPPGGPLNTEIARIGASSADRRKCKTPALPGVFPRRRRDLNPASARTLRCDRGHSR